MRGEFTINTVQPGTWRLVAMGPAGIRTLATPDADTLYRLLVQQLGDDAPFLPAITQPDQWLRVVQAVRMWGSAHVETGNGVDYVITRQRP